MTTRANIFALFRLGFLVLPALLFLAESALAAPISTERAERVAQNWMLLQTGKSPVAHRIDESHAAIMEAQASDSHYYLFDMDPAGWVIVASDDVAYPILGYATDASIVGRTKPPSFVNWMRMIDTSIAEAARQAATGKPIMEASAYATATVIASAWADLGRAVVRSTTSPYGRARAAAVAPLVATTWSQDTFYNQFCPADSAGPGGHALVGCCATAMGQVLRYHAQPAVGQGAHSFDHAHYGTLSANFEATSYNWAAMPSAGVLSYYNSSVATLLNQVGIAIDMDYGSSSSVCYPTRFAPALRKYFNYQAEDLAARSNYSDAAWVGKIKADLDARRPILYAGYGSGGHAFVLDGYTDFNYFHFNWGWNGAYDGYFLLSNLNPGGYSFSSSQMGVFGIRPASSPPPVVPSGPSNLTATANSQSKITLRWSDPSTNERGFRIERKIGTGDWAQIGQARANVTRYANTGLAAGTTFTYRVLAHNTSGVSGYSNEASATTQGGTVNKPAAPSNLVARAASRNQINLIWRDRSTNEQGFRIERKIGAEDWAQIAEVAANTTSYANIGLSPNIRHTYRVRAFNAEGTSAYLMARAVRTPR